MAADDATKGRVGGNVYRRVAANQLKEEFPTTDGHGAFSVVIVSVGAPTPFLFSPHTAFCTWSGQEPLWLPLWLLCVARLLGLLML